jgi:prephenate dehydratase
MEMALVAEDADADEYATTTTTTTTDKNELTMQELTHIRDSIEAMSKFNQIEVLKLLQKDNVVLNENKYGIHINLTDMRSDSLRQLQRFMDYVHTQEQCLNTVEKQKETFKNIYFGSTTAAAKDTKDIAHKVSNLHNKNKYATTTTTTHVNPVEDSLS